jgi:hypothetical protein
MNDYTTLKGQATVKEVRTAALREGFVRWGVQYVKENYPQLFENEGVTEAEYEALAIMKVRQFDEHVGMNWHLVYVDVDKKHWGHDFFGIMRYWNPVSEKMGDCFHPRMAS